MIEITCKPDCGNSPKKQLLMELNIAFAKGDVALITECVTDDIVWNIMGQKTIEGKEKFVEELGIRKSNKVSALVLDQLLSHGKEGAASGTIKMEDGKKYAFSDFYVFQRAKGTKIKSIKSFVIQL